MAGDYSTELAAGDGGAVFSCGKFLAGGRTYREESDGVDSQPINVGEAHDCDLIQVLDGWMEGCLREVCEKTRAKVFDGLTSLLR